MTPDNEIFHVSTGFLSADDLLGELDFAEQVYEQIRNREEAAAEETVAEAHCKKLRQMGFTEQEINAPQDQFAEHTLSGPNPQDLGIDMLKPEDFGIDFGSFQGIARRGGGRQTTRSINPFGDINKLRLLKDHKFVVDNPLITRNEFEQDPTDLVGGRSTFFGTHSGMNQPTEQMNQQMKELRERFRR